MAHDKGFACILFHTKSFDEVEPLLTAMEKDWYNSFGIASGGEGKQ